MKTLVVIAHPLSDSLCQALAQIAIKSLTAAGHEVVVENLYDVGFSPALTEAERQSYYRLPFDASAIAGQVERLLAAEALVLVFPTWWFGFLNNRGQTPFFNGVGRIYFVCQILKWNIYG